MEVNEGRSRKNSRLSNRVCSLSNCKSRISQDVSLHMFPYNKKLRTKWFQALKKTEISTQEKKYLYVCSKHFSKTDYFLPSAGIYPILDQ